MSNVKIIHGNVSISLIIAFVIFYDGDVFEWFVLAICISRVGGLFQGRTCLRREVNEGFLVPFTMCKHYI